MDSQEITRFKEARLGRLAASWGAFDIHVENGPARDPRGRFFIVLRDGTGREPLGQVVGHAPPDRRLLAGWIDSWISAQEGYVATMAARATSSALRAQHDRLLSRLRRVQTARSLLTPHSGH